MVCTLGKAYLVVYRLFADGQTKNVYNRTSQDAEDFITALRAGDSLLKEWERPRIEKPVEVEVVIKDNDHVILIDYNNFIEFQDIKVIREQLEDLDTLAKIKEFTIEDIKEIKKLVSNDVFPIIRKIKDQQDAKAAVEAAKV